jgi:anti-sigma regulatory factor (Ser/Thr protein kinase)
MRRALRAYLVEHTVDAAPAYGVVLEPDEAFINAVSYAAGADDVTSVSACVSKSQVSVEVQDDGGGEFTYRRSHPRSVPDVRRARTVAGSS